MLKFYNIRFFVFVFFLIFLIIFIIKSINNTNHSKDFDYSKYVKVDEITKKCKKVFYPEKNLEIKKKINLVLVGSSSSHLNYNPKNLFDGDNNTVWHTEFDKIISEWITFKKQHNLQKNIKSISIVSSANPAQFFNTACLLGKNFEDKDFNGIGWLNTNNQTFGELNWKIEDTLIYDEYKIYFPMHKYRNFYSISEIFFSE